MPPSHWVEQVREIVQRVCASDATEVEYSRDGFSLRIRRRPGFESTPAATAEDAPPAQLDAFAIIAPLTGVFYRASSPGGAPYVGQGDPVTSETVIGLIETMKIFNEVLSERQGRIIEILVESGQLVHVGDQLMLIAESDEISNGEEHR